VSLAALVEGRGKDDGTDLAKGTLAYATKENEVKEVDVRVKVNRLDKER
jgi:hypothetical protein